MERPAQKGHTAANRLAAGQAGDGLIHHRLKDGGGQIRFGSPLVDEGLYIGLGEYAATGGDGVDLFIVGGLLVEAGGIGLQKCRHLVDKGAGAAGANAIHPLLQSAGEVDDLGILAAQLNGHVGLRRHGGQGGGHRHHLLYEGDSQRLAQVDGAGAGDLHP